MSKLKQTPHFRVESRSAAREEAARQLKNSEQAAREVADLCAQAAKTARLHKVPHAGVGKTSQPQT